MSVNRLIYRFQIVIYVFLVACSSQNEPEPSIVPRLVDYTAVSSWNSGNLKADFNAINLDFNNDKMIHNGDIYRITYLTTYKESQIHVSGLVFMPRVEEPVSFFSYQHGTIAGHHEAPSRLPVTNFNYLLLSALSSTGFITVVPDYVGFGDSEPLMHPYYVEEPSANVVIDGLRAAYEVAALEKVPRRNTTYLGGYSQGGYVTMAAHKAFEEQDIEYFDLQASFPAAGGYDIPEVQARIFDQGVFEQPFFITYAAEAYRNHYEGILDLAEIFQSPYSGQIPTLHDGTLEGDDINDQLNDTLMHLMTSAYYPDPDPQEFAEILQAFQENSIINWAPQIPIVMYHGEADTWVPYATSLTTRDNWISSGASPALIEMITLPEADHVSGFFPYLLDSSERLLEMEGL